MTFQGHREKLILRRDYYFYPPDPYFVKMIFLAMDITTAALSLILKFRDCEGRFEVCPEKFQYICQS